MPRRLRQALLDRQKADYFQFGDAYEQAILRVIEQHIELFEDFEYPLVQKIKENKDQTQDEIFY